MCFKENLQLIQLHLKLVSIPEINICSININNYITRNKKVDLKFILTYFDHLYICYFTFEVFLTHKFILNIFIFTQLSSYSHLLSSTNKYHPSPREFFFFTRDCLSNRTKFILKIIFFWALKSAAWLASKARISSNKHTNNSRLLFH